MIAQPQNQAFGAYAAQGSFMPTVWGRVECKSKKSVSKPPKPCYHGMHFAASQGLVSIRSMAEGI